MKAQRSGKIVNTSSMTVPSGIPGFLHYVSSKSAIVGLTRALARELGDWNISVNTITPDYVPHDAEYAARQPDMSAFIASQRAFKRDQVPEDLVGMILFLAGHGSDFVHRPGLLGERRPALQLTLGGEADPEGDEERSRERVERTPDPRPSQEVAGTGAGEREGGTPGERPRG